MSFLLGKDWNVLTITFERANLFRINGNRTKGRDANKIRDNAKRHARTIYWAVFNQKGKLLDSGPGPYGTTIPAATLERISRELSKNASVLNVLEQLQKGESDKAAKILDWDDDKTEKESTPSPSDSVKVAAAKPAPAAAAAQRETTNVFRLIVASGEGDEFESSLKLIDRNGQLSGTLVAPDGEAAPIERAQRQGSSLSFEFSLGAGEEALSLKFQGTIEKDLVKGTLS
ncbi:MAG TPA: hypothetical protein VMV10_05130 [Pirellulales bacterium]|nr:hypothetical protein [Pirellulales bacterium]